jgi:hypothetical protein
MYVYNILYTYIYTYAIIRPFLSINFSMKLLIQCQFQSHRFMLSFTQPRHWVPNVCRMHSDLMLSAGDDPNAAHCQRHAAPTQRPARSPGVPGVPRAVNGDGWTTEP